ncbi:hypothetical protein C4580_04180 [Candidatus Woesearchaeota archaeon]|nr:MAG: hypothetical protein C4580_04180 [Candidatus Woesearchaeota archaeon]
MGIGDWFGKKEKLLPHVVENVREAIAKGNFEDAGRLIHALGFAVQAAADAEAEDARHFGGFAQAHVKELVSAWRTAPDGQKRALFEQKLQEIEREFGAHMQVTRSRYERGGR